jgi:hypothetical protein
MLHTKQADPLASRRLRLGRAALLLILCCGATAAAAGQGELGYPGYLVIDGARGSDRFAWEEGPQPGQKSLVWEGGSLTLPDSTAADSFGAAGYGFRCEPQLRGRGAGGLLVFTDGIYPVSEPLVLEDGVLRLEVTAGELEIRGARLRYMLEPVRDRSRRTQADFLFVAGLVLAIVVLLRRARAGRRTGRRT